MKNLLIYFVFSCLVLGCASGHCGRDGKAVRVNSAKLKIFVYKYDGSKQCEQGTGTDLKTMGAELSSMKVFSMSKKSDGQIRVQVCGALTGMANVYEISSADFAKAEALGFKKWSF
jgi:hypothetical protein